MISSSSAIMSEDTDDTTLTFGEEQHVDTPKPRNRIAVFFHLIFRFLAILTYLLCGLFSGGFIVNFVIIVLLLSVDFWTVKNITGRLLVGLRWWNYVDEEGVSHWVYESRKGGEDKANSMQGRIFWLSLVVTEVFWAVFVLASLLTLSLKWLMVACVGVALNGANLYGYVRCKIGSRKKMKSAATSFLGQQVLGSMLAKFSSEPERTADDQSAKK